MYNIDYLGLSFFFMGIFSKFALVLFDEDYEQNIFKSDIKLLYISTFQLVGFIPGRIYLFYVVLSYNIFKRKQVCLITSILASLLSFILLMIGMELQIENSKTIISIYSLLGVNGFL